MQNAAYLLTYGKCPDGLSAIERKQCRRDKANHILINGKIHQKNAFKPKQCVVEKKKKLICNNNQLAGVLPW